MTMENNVGFDWGTNYLTEDKTKKRSSNNDSDDNSSSDESSDEDDVDKVGKSSHKYRKKAVNTLLDQKMIANIDIEK